MRSQIGQPLSLQSMARIGFASRFHFNRTFRQITGIPPSQFLYALRLDAARRLLTQTQRKVIDICYDVGYNSVGTFTRRFTNVLGVSPTAFRELTQAPRAAVPRHRAASPKRRMGHRVSGRISVPGDFHGMILVGLFETPIPQAQPVACAIAGEQGFYQIEDAPEGEFYLFALGLEHPIHAPECFQYETALRGGGQSLRIGRTGTKGITGLHLRPPASFDPPILMALTLLIDQFFGESKTGNRVECGAETGPQLEGVTA
jgi:AraC-like DNA-binding protein